MISIGLIDYHKGNIRSVAKAFEGCGCNVVVTDDPQQLDTFDGVVLPGVGAFTDAANTLQSLGMTEPLRKYIALERPFLGICLGMHLMFEGGTEHAQGAPTRGLGVIEGVVDAMPAESADGVRFKIPHVGWNRIQKTALGAESPILRNVEDGEHFYFTHSYIAPESDATIAESTHSVTFPCAVQRGLAFGVQFHPEKSSDAGLELIKGFVDVVSESV